MRRTRTTEGFTLIEVLVAIGIAAIGLAAVLSVVTNSTANASSQRTRTIASWVALNRITRTRLGSSLPAVEVTRGEEELGNLKWHWEQNVTQTDVPNILRIDVRVRLADDPAEYTRATLSAFAGRAQMSSPPTESGWDVAATGNTGAGGGTGAGTSGDAAGGQQGATGTPTPGNGNPRGTNPATTTTPAGTTP